MPLTGEAYVPPGLSELLQNFTIAVMKDRPDDLIFYAANYFGTLHNRNNEQSNVRDLPMQLMLDDNACSAIKPGAQKGENALGLGEASKSFSGAGKYHAGYTALTPMQDLVSSDDSDREPLLLPSVHSRARRRSICAEGYDPSAEKLDEKPIVHPKSSDQRMKLAEAVKGIFIFRGLESDQMSRVLDAMLEKPVKAGETIIKQGDEQADFFYVISSGVFDVYLNDVKEKSYKEKGSFGELALMYNTPRSRTIRAATDGALWALDRVTFRKIVLKAAYEKRKYFEEVIASVPMFKCLKEYEQTSLADAFKTMNFPDGAEIIREKLGDKTKELSRLGRGHYFGELALLTHQPRAASVFSVGETKCAVIDVNAFERLLGPCMEIMRREKEETYAKNMERALATDVPQTGTK